MKLLSRTRNSERNEQIMHARRTSLSTTYLREIDEVVSERESRSLTKNAAARFHRSIVDDSWFGGETGIRRRAEPCVRGTVPRRRERCLAAD